MRLVDSAALGIVNYASFSSGMVSGLITVLAAFFFLCLMIRNVANMAPATSMRMKKIIPTVALPSSAS